MNARVVEEPHQWDWLLLARTLTKDAGRAVVIEQEPRMSFSAGEVASIFLEADGTVRLRQHDFGLLDSGGPLPERYVEAAFDEVRQKGTGAWFTLVNMLTDRFAQCDLRAWASRLEGDNGFSSIENRDTFESTQYCPSPWQEDLISRGYLAHRCVGPEMLVDVLQSRWAGASVSLEQRVFQWLSSPPDVKQPFQQRLGCWIIGDMIPSSDTKAALYVDLPNWNIASDFLLKRITHELGMLLSFVGNQTLDWSVHLTGHTRPARCPDDGALMRLGVDSWIADRNAAAEDFRCTVELTCIHSQG